MFIRSLKLKNYRAFEGETKENKVIFENGVNLIVGENNVGKSSLLRALKIVSGQISKGTQEIFMEDTNREFLIEAEIELNEEEMRQLISRITANHDLLKDSLNWQRFVNDLGNKFILRKSSKNRVTVETSSIYFKGTDASSREIFSTGNALNINEFLKRYFESPQISILELMEDLRNSKIKPNIRFEGSLEGFLENLINAKLKIVTEIRKRPFGPNKRVNESLDGGEVASVLFTLKNGDKKERKKYQKIQQEFNTLFSNLEFDVGWKDDSQPTIFVDKIPIDHQVSVENVGAGIGEMIILLTLLTGAEGLIIGLDLPEMQFHPQSQRLLSNLLERHANKNQIITVTHSPWLLNPKKLENITMVKARNGRSFANQLPQNYFNRTEKAKLDRFLLSNSKDFFFSRTTLIVEGPTESGAMPVFGKNLGIDFDSLGISIVEMDGNHFGLQRKLLIGFGIPHFVMSDKDALMNISRGKITCEASKIKSSSVFCSLEMTKELETEHKQRIAEIQNQIVQGGDGLETYPEGLFEELREIALNYNVFVLPSNFEGVLTGAGYSDFIEEAGKISNSKVIRGRFVAEKIVMKKRPIPSVFNEVLKKTKEISLSKN